MKKGASLKCYYCGHEDEDCSAGASGIEVSCQTSNEEEPHYGDSCYVGHSGIVAYIQSLVQTNYSNLSLRIDFIYLCSRV